MNKNHRLHHILPFAGLIPFVLVAVLTVLGVAWLPYLGSVMEVGVVYGLVIASFMCGNLWGQSLRVEARFQGRLIVVSNLLAVGLWLGFLVLPQGVMLAVLSGFFLLLLLIEFNEFRGGRLQRGYMFTRLWVTVVVIVCLGIMRLA